MASISIKIDDDISRQSQKILSNLGMDVSTYISMVLKQLVEEDSIPSHQNPVCKYDSRSKDEAFESMERIINSKTEPIPETDYKKEIESYRDERYGKLSKKEAYLRLDRLRVKGTVTDYDAELESYRKEKYGE